MAALLALPFVHATNGSAQRVVTGRVLDAETGAPIPGVDVRQAPDGAATVTDASGSFRLIVRRQGQARIRAAAIGYAALDTLVTASPVDLRLSPRPVRLEPLTVIATPSASGLDAPQPGEIRLRGETVRAVPDVGEADLLRVLDVLPGVTARNELATNLAVRGSPGDQTHVMLRGARIYAPYHMLGFVGAVNPDAIDRLDFARGYTPLDAPGAAGLITLQPVLGHPPSVDGSAAVGLITARAAVTSATSDGALRWSLAGRHSHLDAISTLIGREGQGDYSFGDANAAIRWTPAPGQSLDIAAMISGDQADGTFSGDRSLRTSWRSESLSAVWEQPAGRRWTVRASGGYSGYDGSVGTFAAPSDSRIAEAFVGASTAYWGSGVEARVGARISAFDVRLDGAEDGGVVEGRYSARPVDWLAFGEVVFPLEGHVTSSAGLRVYAPEGRTLLEPQARISLASFPRVGTVTVSASSSHQVLSQLVDDRYVLPGAPLWYRHTAGDPVTGRSDVTLSVSRDYGADLSATYSAYAAWLSDVLHWQPVGDRTLDQVRFDDGTARGAELLVQWRPRPWSAWVAYTLSEVRLEGPAGTYRPSWDRRHVLTALLSRQLFDRHLLTARLNVSSGGPIHPIGGYVRLNRFEPYRGDVGAADLTPIFSDSQVDTPLYVRLDLGARFLWDWNGARWGLKAGVVNALARPNVLYYRLSAPPPGSDATRRLQPVASSPYRVLPSLEIDVRF